MVFAASFFGAFEITLPQSLVNKSDQNSDKKGLAGVFFMALTLVLVSFSCTGPIVGNVLIQATSSGGSFWTPIVVMLAFSTAFAIPFTVFAFSPTLLKKFKKSGGGWLNSVKVVIGFVEVALGLKFLSVADQTYHWGILDREVYLAIWIVVFALLGLYLLGKIRFAHDEPIEKLSVTRLTLAIAVLSFVVYLIPGMWGAPLKALSGYLPPIHTHDFIVNNTGLQGRGKLGHPEIDSVTFEQGTPTPMDREGMPKYLAAEMCHTMNEHWGFGGADFCYKSSASLIETLCACRKVGANYLLNIGPEGDGKIPFMQEALIRTVGEWVNKTGECIYKAKPCGVIGEYKNFALEADGKLYFFVRDLSIIGNANVTVAGGGAGEKIFTGVKGKVKSVRWVDNGEVLDFAQEGETLKIDCTGYPYGTNLVVRIAEAEIE
jgi:hypothetical protein